jgi:hypothetical protein
MRNLAAQTIAEAFQSSQWSAFFGCCRMTGKREVIPRSGLPTI